MSTGPPLLGHRMKGPPRSRAHDAAADDLAAAQRLRLHGQRVGLTTIRVRFSGATPD
jgi:hypothetical protein